jgi:hypothetical protein
MEHDVPLLSADFPHDDVSHVEGTANVRRQPEISHEVDGGGIQRGLDREEAMDRARLGHSRGDRPRDDHLVADVLIDLAAVILDRIGCEDEHTIEEGVDRYGPDALGQRGGADDVDEEEESLLLSWSVIAPQHPVAQRSPADDLADLNDEENGPDDPEGEEHGHQLHGAGVDREAKETGAGLRHIDESDQ